MRGSRNLLLRDPTINAAPIPPIRLKLGVPKASEKSRGKYPLIFIFIIINKIGAIKINTNPVVIQWTVIFARTMNSIARG